jgi:hypothetical protein
VRKLSRAWILLAVAGFCLSAEFRVYAADARSVVTIYCKDSSGSSQGTGFLFGQDGLIVTAYHVVENAKTIEIRDNSFRLLSGITIEHLDPEHDIAILKSTPTGLPGLVPTTEIQPAQTGIVVVGSPRGTSRQTFSGQITSDGQIDSMSLSGANARPIFARSIAIFTTDVTIYSGMSGAPVLSQSGEVIGILSGSYEEGRGIGWAIPIGYALDLLRNPSSNITVNQVGVWPAMDLMGPAWISLKRSFGKQFDSDQIGQLETLESLFLNLRGRWKSEIDRYDSINGCNLTLINVPKLTFERVDEDQTAITGEMKQSLTMTTVPVDPHYPVSNMEEVCNQSNTGDTSVSQKTSTNSGTVKLRVLDFDSADKLRYQVHIKDCEGWYCKASSYGDQAERVLEIISDTKLRLDNFIFTKSDE